VANEDELIPAATVILAKDAGPGIEVLMLRRNSAIAFGGAWVFPGGRLDPEDVGTDDLDRSRAAAAREAMEETGLAVDRHALTPWSYWVPPAAKSMVVKGKRRRFSTWFFLATAPDGGVTVDMGEIHDHQWMEPCAAIALHRRGEIELIPPTWLTLHQLSAYASVAEAIAAGASQPEPKRFITRPIPGDPVMLTWQGDVAYEDTTLVHSEGGRNRLILAEGNWVYELRS
jgi:8-oxo-dGTP pyrophosphatase MutT (NUDIX family)